MRTRPCIARSERLILCIFGVSVIAALTGCAKATFVVHGTVSGLQGSGLVLQENGGNSLAVSASGPFAFSGSLPIGTVFSLTVFSQPSNPS